MMGTSTARQQQVSLRTEAPIQDLPTAVVATQALRHHPHPRVETVVAAVVVAATSFTLSSGRVLPRC